MKKKWGGNPFQIFLKMSKIEFDKYYTPTDVANYCIDKTIEVIGRDNITDVLEPSCGSGAFFHNQNLTPNTGIDILPEICSDNILPNKYSIIKGDFLQLQIPYKEGRLVIGNPPYGERLNLAQKFYKKSVQIGDYISFILPISQLHNTQSMYEFDLVHSEDLGVKSYSDRELHCCLNIYKRPSGGLNIKPINKLQDVTIIRNDSKGYDNFDYDIRMGAWGNGCVGEILDNTAPQLACEYKIKINNAVLKQQIINFITTFDWKRYLSSISMKRLKIYHVIQALKENIPQVK